MATATKKTPATTKTAASATTKTTTKKVASKPATTKTTAKDTAATTSKKTVAKATEKKLTAAKPASTETKPVKKAATVKETAPKVIKASVSPEHRYHMIATAAYFLAQKRGFAGGYEMQDWISAEAQIDTQLKS